MQADLGYGVSIRYTSEGEGFPVFLIMGFGATSDLWSPEFKNPLAQAHRVLAFDNRGIGGSKGPSVPPSIAIYAQDAIGLMDHLGIGKAHFIGISMGGMIAQQIAVRYPDRVAKLVLGATTCSSRYIRHSPALLGLWLIGIAPRLALRALVSDEYLERHPEVVEKIRSYARLHRASLKSLKQQSQSVSSFDLDDQVTSIKAPTLIIAGTGDRIINSENSLILASRIRGSKLIEFPGVGHAFTLERGPETNQAILDFLAV